MKRFLISFFAAAVVLAASVAAVTAQQVKRAPFDVSSYLIDAQLAPVENRLTASTAVTFTPQEETRSVTFELNGSLKVDSVTRTDRSAVTPPAKGKPAAPPASAAAPPRGRDREVPAANVASRRKPRR